jgi:hypothetical protein
MNRKQKQIVYTLQRFAFETSTNTTNYKYDYSHTACDLDTLPWMMLEVQHMAVKHHYIDLSIEETLQLPGFITKCQNVLLV